MKSAATILSQVFIIAIGVAALGFLLWEPHLEGRNAQATTFEIYFRDPFLAYAYAVSILIFVGLYKAFRLAGYARNGQLLSPDARRAVRAIKYCAMAFIGFIVATEIYIFVAVRGKDDIAGGVAMGVMLLIASMLVALAAGALEMRLAKASATQLAA